MGTMERKVLYATTEEGVRTAVIDVTHPAFRVTVTESELAAMAEQYILEAGQQREMPEAVREALRNSTLGRALMAASGTFLDGMTTYRLKLGPENLGKRLRRLTEGSRHRFRRLRRGCGCRTCPFYWRKGWCGRWLSNHAGECVL